MFYINVDVKGKVTTHHTEESAILEATVLRTVNWKAVGLPIADAIPLPKTPAPTVHLKKFVVTFWCSLVWKQVTFDVYDFDEASVRSHFDNTCPSRFRTKPGGEDTLAIGYMGEVVSFPIKAVILND